MSTDDPGPGHDIWPFSSTLSLYREWEVTCQIKSSLLSYSDVISYSSSRIRVFFQVLFEASLCGDLVETPLSHSLSYTVRLTRLTRFRIPYLFPYTPRCTDLLPLLNHRRPILDGGWKVNLHSCSTSRNTTRNPDPKWDLHYSPVTSNKSVSRCVNLSLNFRTKNFIHTSSLPSLW